MRKKITKFTVYVLIFCLSVLSINAQAMSYSWYCMPGKNNEQPDSYEAKNFIDSYNAIYLGNKDEKAVYLTFDAGYENGNVEKILDILKKHNAPGAFFVLPNLIKSNTDLVKRMANEGHLVCNHTKSHRDMSKISNIEKFKEELLSLEETYKEYTGEEMSKFYRPPEGRFSEENLKFADQLGYTTVFWSLAYADWDNNKQMPCDKAKNLILSRIHNGCVLLLHPTSATNANILDDLLTELENRGYTFKSLRDFKK